MRRGYAQQLEEYTMQTGGGAPASTGQAGLVQTGAAPRAQAPIDAAAAKSTRGEERSNDDPGVAAACSGVPEPGKRGAAQLAIALASNAWRPIATCRNSRPTGAKRPLIGPTRRGGMHWALPAVDLTDLTAAPLALIVAEPAAPGPYDHGRPL